MAAVPAKTANKPLIKFGALMSYLNLAQAVPFVAPAVKDIYDL